MTAAAANVPLMRVLIADDEPLARAALRAILSRVDSVVVVGEARNGSEAAAAIAAHRPDVVFLDVEMPEMDGFAALDAARALAQAPPAAVVFVTAHPERAPEAFDVNAVDYVLKPLRPSRVVEAVGRARQRRFGTAAHASGPPLGVKVGDRIRVLDQRAVDWVEADDEHVVLHTAGGGRLRIRETLAGLERRLDPALFARLHRSTLVNVARIRELQPYFHGDCYVILHDGTRLRLSRTYRDRVERVVGTR